ncbi:MAG: nuclear transport factor 2 family protein [Acidobacteriota bacterium]|nr:nuclear transport factor 2 family protein [Acidobacteriota bacterium]
MKTKFIAGIVALLFVVLLGYRATAARNDTQSRADDRAQIENLMWNYSRALYSQNPDAYAALYTPDGQFGTGEHAVKGRDAIKKMIENLKRREAAQQPVYVMDLDNHIEFSDRNHAHLEAYWLEVTPRTGQKAAQVVNAGRQVEDFERINGQWLIKFRDPAPKD